MQNCAENDHPGARPPPRASGILRTATTTISQLVCDLPSTPHQYSSSLHTMPNTRASFAIRQLSVQPHYHPHRLYPASADEVIILSSDDEGPPHKKQATRRITPRARSKGKARTPPTQIVEISSDEEDDSPAPAKQASGSLSALERKVKDIERVRTFRSISLCRRMRIPDIWSHHPHQENEMLKMHITAVCQIETRYIAVNYLTHVA